MLNCITTKYLICGDCGYSGEEDDFPLGNGGGYEPNYLNCPKCKSDWIMPADECVICGDITSTDELKFSMCERCRDEIETEVESVIDLFVSKACGNKADEADTDIREFIGDFL